MLFFFLATCILVSIALCAALCGYFAIKAIQHKNPTFRHWSIASGLLCGGFATRISDTLITSFPSLFILGLIAFIIGFHQIFLGLESLQKHKDYKLNRHALPVLGVGVASTLLLLSFPSAAESVAMFFSAALALLSEGVLYNDKRNKHEKRGMIRHLLLITSFLLFLHGTVSIVNSITGGMDDLSLLYRFTSILMVLSTTLIGVSLMRDRAQSQTQLDAARRHSNGLNLVLPRDTFIKQVRSKLHQTKDHESVLIIVEIDNYQDMLKTYGNSAGESASYQIGQAIIHFTRSNDIAGKISENKFAVLLERMSIDTVHIVADRLVKQMLSKNIQTLDSTPMFTASIGIAPSPEIVFSWKPNERCDIKPVQQENGTNSVYMLTPLNSAAL